MEDSPLEFARLSWLIAGPVVCALLALALVFFDRKKEAILAKLVHPRFRERLTPGHSKRLLWTKRSLWLAALLLLFVAAAGPRKGFEWREVKRRGIDILFAVDTSRSMLAEDLTPNRLERARMGMHDFVDRLKGDRIGLVPFAGSAYALCPLTLDYDAFRESLDALDTDIIPRQGTDVASAIREADRLFDEQGNNHRILVLITDGEDLQGDALEAAKEAAGKGMAIYPVGVGSADGVQIPLRLANGAVDVLRDDSGAPVRSKLDEASLRKIADATGGLYAALGRGAEGLDVIYREKLRLVPQNEMESRMEKIPFERFEWPLAAAILLLLMEFLLPDRRRPAKAAPLPSAARRHRIPAAPLLALTWLVITSSQSTVQAAEDPRVVYNRGAESYEAADYAKALEHFNSALKTPDLQLQNRAYYNLGNTHFRLGQAVLADKPEETIKAWEESVKAFNAALALDSDDADARYNLDLVTRKLEELKKQQEKKDDKDDQKENKDDQKKDQKEKEDQKEKQDPKEEQKQDQQSQEQKDGEQKDSQSKGGEEKEGQPQDGQQKDGEQKSGEPKEGEQQQPGEDGKPESDKNQDSEPTGKMKEDGGEKKDEPQAGGQEKPGEKEGEKAGEKKDAAKPAGGEEKDGEPKPGEKKDAVKEGDADQAAAEKKESGEAISEERRKPGEMTPVEARQLLQTLRGDERTVIPFQRPPQQRRFRDPNNTVKGKTW